MKTITKLLGYFFKKEIWSVYQSNDNTSVILVTVGVWGSVATNAGLGNLRVRSDSTWNNTVENVLYVNQNPDPAKPGGNVELRFKVENLGYQKYQDVVFQILPQYPFTLLPDDDGLRRLGDIEAKQVGEDAYIITYKLAVDKEASEGTHAIRIRYSTDNGKVWYRVNPFSINVQSFDAILSVVSVASIPEQIAAGNLAQVTMRFKNNADTQIENIKIKLNLVDRAVTTTGIAQVEKPFTPIGSSNEKSIDVLGAGEEKEVVFSLQVDPDAESKVYKIPVDLSYTDRLGKAYGKNLTLGLIVYDKPEITVSLDTATARQTKTKGNVVFRVSNVGPANIKFVSAVLQGSEDYTVLSAEQLYLGNIDSDDYESAEYQIYINADKTEVPLRFVLRYKDSFNNEMEQTETVALRLYSGQEAAMFGLSTGSNFTTWLPAITILSILIVFWLYMLIDCIKNPLPKYKKALWVLLFFLSNIVGAVLYYFLARRKNVK
ncbi:PLDc N-terminal domain-containing protein [Candidatus Woesearchaeota archaeon]|nr:PLDc N-terminal domain-containing protein [Candidatus Woesearchaeota archaeon]